MRKIFNILPLFLLVGCQLITEPDISDSTVYLLAPVDSLKTTSVTHTLWWDHVPDAESYNVLVVSPSWDAVEVLITDTNVTGNKFTITLPSGKGEYDWGVMAYNYSSSGLYSVRHITIDTSSSLTGKKVVLDEPGLNHSDSSLKQVFKWFELDGADSYIFDIRVGSWEGDSYLPPALVFDISYSALLEEGVYYWGVKANNDFSNTSTSYTTRALYIDRTAPGNPRITHPVDNGDTISTDNLKISWERSGTSIAPVWDSVYISVDTNFIEGSKTQGYKVNETEFYLNSYSAGKYFTKVRSIDEAGNASARYSSTRTFYISNEE